MKRKLVFILAGVLACAVLFTGCGDKDEETSASSSASSGSEEEADVYDTEYLMAATDYDITEYVTLGEYEGLSVEVDSSYEVTEENLAAAIESLLEYTPIYYEKDSAAEEGDTVDIDYVGTIDGEEFDGGSAEGDELELGSDSFIDGFEDGLIGCSAGDTVSLDLTFPDDYSEEDYAGLDVTFEVTVNAVYEVEYVAYEDLTDEDVAAGFEDDYGLTTVEELEETMEASLESSLLSAVQSAYLEVLVENSAVEIPDEINEEIDEQIASIEETAESYGIDLDTYLSYSGYTDEEEYRTYMEESYTELLVLEALVNELQIEVDGDDFTAFVEYLISYYSSYGYEEEDFYEMYGSKANLVLQYAEYQVVLTDLADDAVITYVESEDEDTE